MLGQETPTTVEVASHRSRPTDAVEVLRVYRAAGWWPARVESDVAALYRRRGIAPGSCACCGRSCSRSRASRSSVQATVAALYAGQPVPRPLDRRERHTAAVRKADAAELERT